MSDLHCIQLASVEELRAGASAWDDLWWRSDVPLPTVRAEILAQWVEQFSSPLKKGTGSELTSGNPAKNDGCEVPVPFFQRAARPRGGFRALVVADRERWVAALPLVPCRVGGLISAGTLPTNPWLPCGELLLDTAADADAAMDRLLTAAAGLPWQLLWLNETLPETPRWQALLRAGDRAAVPACCHQRFRVGRVEIAGDWDAYQKHLPKNHRQAMRRALRRLEGEGRLQFEMQSHMAPEEVEPWLHAAFELEDAGWKGDAGTSVLRTPGMFRFFVRWAEQLARWGQLETASLKLDGRVVSFVSGFRAKGVYFAHKIGYDPRYAAYSPGQLLFHHILEQLHNEGDVRALDFLGPLNHSLSRWRPATYGVARTVLAPRRWLGRAAMYAYQHCWRPLKDLRAAASARRGDREKTPAIDDFPILEPAGAVG